MDVTIICMEQQPNVRHAPPLNGRRYLPSRTVMEMLNYRNRASFHEWIKSSGVPHTRLNARKIVFDESALSAWLETRTSSSKAS